MPCSGAARLQERPVLRPSEVIARGDRRHPRPVERRASRLDRRAPRRCGADRARWTPERGQVVAPAGPLGDPDQDGRLPVHDVAPDSGTHEDRWRPDPARGDPRREEGATEDRGGGRALLGVLRSADAIVYCTRADGDPEELRPVLAEVALAGIDKPAFLAATRADEATTEHIARLRAAFPDLAVVPVSVIDEASLDAFRDATWALTSLIRVRLRTMGETDPEPLALAPGATVADVADWIHHDIATTFVGARVWGPSARFEGQRVGREHEVQDGDVVEILR